MVLEDTGVGAWAGEDGRSDSGDEGGAERDPFPVVGLTPESLSSEP